MSAITPAPGAAPAGELVVTDEVWEAIAGRSRAGGFVFAVRTTGVYCHPWCPARRPHRRHVAAFADPSSADAAGFRACRRCRPDESVEHPHAALVGAALEALDGPEPPPTLTALAEVVGVSPWHLHRVFRAATGLSPRGYLAARRLTALETALPTAGSVATAGYDAGYGSSRGLYADAGALGMAPAAWRAGGIEGTLWVSRIDTPLGPVVTVASDRGLVALEFGEPDDVLPGLRSRFPRSRVVEGADPALTAAVQAHFAGGDTLVELPLDLRASAFRLRVWQAVRAIPRGETRTYTEIAEALGAPGSVRAVAGACAANPVGLAVPCHRVVRRDGTLAGYRWGVDRKAALLSLEAGGGDPRSTDHR